PAVRRQLRRIRSARGRKRAESGPAGGLRLRPQPYKRRARTSALPLPPPPNPAPFVIPAKARTQRAKNARAALISPASRDGQIVSRKGAKAQRRQGVAPRGEAVLIQGCLTARPGRSPEPPVQTPQTQTAFTHQCSPLRLR